MLGNITQPDLGIIGSCSQQAHHSLVKRREGRRSRLLTGVSLLSTGDQLDDRVTKSVRSARDAS
jgi:hypothetical protein